MRGVFAFILFSLFGASPESKAAPRGNSNFIVNGTWTQSSPLNLPPSLGRSRPPQPFSPFFPSASPREIADAFLRTNFWRTGARQAADFRFRSQLAGTEATSLRFRQERNIRLTNGLDIPVEVKGGELVMHVGGNSLLFASASAPENLFALHKQTLTAEDARAIAFLEFGSDATKAINSGLKILLAKSPQGEMRESLAYIVRVTGMSELEEELLYIDAHDGTLLRSTPTIQTLSPQIIVFGEANRSDEAKLINVIDSTRDEISTNLMPEDIFPIALSSASCPGSPSPAKFCTDAIDEKTAEIARLTWRNAELTDKFFHDKFARNSFDGSGATVRSLIRFRAGWANAGWIDELGMIVYGDGNPFVHHPFAKALDISAHELTHGLTARTSALDYVSEPGALNESYSDVFAKLISREFEGGDDWTLGKAIFLTEGRFLRDMRNPNISHVRDQIHRNETCSFRNDGCGVHANSGIPNLAAVLLADQIGVEDFGKLYFSVLTRYLRPNSDFKDALAQTLAACELIWGENNSRCTAVTSSFQAVGIE